jgi:hypothetical protein
MKTMLKFFAALALVLGITLATPQSLFAGKPAKKKEPEKPSSTTVSAISESSITTASKNGSRTYTIDKHATIRVFGNTAPISAVQVGMRVMVGTNSKGEASSITASAAPAPEKKK